MSFDGDTERLNDVEVVSNVSSSTIIKSHSNELEVKWMLSAEVQLSRFL